MNVVIWIAIAASFLGSVSLMGGTPVFRSKGRVDERALAKLSKQVGLPLPEHLRRPIVDRMAKRNRTAMWFAVAGLVVGSAVAIVVDVASGREGIGGPLAFRGVSVGLAVGAIVAVLRPAPDLVEGAPRVARASAVSTGDYSTGAEHVASRLALPGAVIAAAISVVMAQRVVDGGIDAPYAVPLAVGLGIVSVVGWVLLLVTERRIAAQPQFANNDLEPAWDDAERAMVIRSVRSGMVVLVMLPALTAIMLIFAAAPLIRDTMSTDPGLATFALIGGIVALACVVVPAIIQAVGARRRNPSLKLWRNTEFASAPV